jgi:hypothetical protein
MEPRDFTDYHKIFSLFKTPLITQKIILHGGHGEKQQNLYFFYKTFNPTKTKSNNKLHKIHEYFENLTTKHTESAKVFASYIPTFQHPNFPTMK